MSQNIKADIYSKGKESKKEMLILLQTTKMINNFCAIKSIYITVYHISD